MPCSRSVSSEIFPEASRERSVETNDSIVFSAVFPRREFRCGIFDFFKDLCLRHLVVIRHNNIENQIGMRRTGNISNRAASIRS